MIYGEKFYSRRYPKSKQIIIRFRIDPVPRTGEKLFVGNKKWFYAWHKRPKTTQERKFSYEYTKYIRGRRNSNNLPNTYDDKLRSDIRNRRSWKRYKIRRQWGKKNFKKFAGVIQW